MRNTIYVLAYLAVGLVLHLIWFGAGPFSWIDPWTYVHAVLWPIFLAIRALYLLALAGAIGLTYLGWKCWR